MQTHTAVPSPQKSVHSINGFPWVAALYSFFLEETPHPAPAAYYFERLKSLGYVGVPVKEFNRKLDEWVTATIITSGGPHLYGSRPRAAQPAPIVPRAFQPAAPQVAPPAPVMAPPTQTQWAQPVAPQPAVPAQVQSVEEVVNRLMALNCLQHPTFVVEKLMQSLVQKEVGQLVHIKTIGDLMRDFAIKNGLYRWKNEPGFTGETVGYSSPRVSPPNAAWMRIG